MKTLAAATILVAALGMSACQRGTGNNSSSITINGQAIGQSIENGAKDVGNFAADAGNTIGNAASKAGDVIENTAKAGWNEVKDATRSDGDGNASTNKSGN